MVSLVSFKREPLEQYLAASNFVLVRMFDFFLRRRDKGFMIPRWPSGRGDVYSENEDFFYRQRTNAGKGTHLLAAFKSFA